MKISICLPVKGRPRMLAQTLHSILAQGYDDIELVIQDGGTACPACDDPLVSGVLRLFGSRLSYSVGNDGGIFPATNTCLRRSTGDILYFMCSDDLLCPGAFDSVKEIFTGERFGGPFWMYGKTISANKVGMTLGIDGGPTTYDELLQHNQLGQPSVFWNRQLMGLAGAFDTRYRHAADYDLWLRFWQRCEPVFLDQTLGIFRHHDEQSTVINKDRVDEEAYKISQRHRFLRDVLHLARNEFNARQAYGGEAGPTTEH